MYQDIKLGGGSYEHEKWYHLFLLTGFMMLVSLGMSVKADAATIMDLERKFPNGAYWNHVVQSGHRYSNYNDVGSCNNPDATHGHRVIHTREVLE